MYAWQYSMPRCKYKNYLAKNVLCEPLFFISFAEMPISFGRFAAFAFLTPFIVALFYIFILMLLMVTKIIYSMKGCKKDKGSFYTIL